MGAFFWGILRALFQFGVFFFFWYGYTLADTKNNHKNNKKENQMKKSIRKEASRVFFVALACIAFVSSHLSANSPKKSIQERSQEIEQTFQTKINELESRLKVIIEAEQRNKPQTESYKGSGYEHYLSQFESKKESAKDLSKHHNQYKQEAIAKAKESAKAYNAENELAHLEENVGKISSEFLSKIKHAKANLRATPHKQSLGAQTPHAQSTKNGAKSIYKEKIEWILQSFENEHNEIVSGAYNAFSEHLASVYDKK